MKLHYYPETDSLYIELKAGPGSETREVAPGVNADFGADGTSQGSISTGRAGSTWARWRRRECR